LRRRILGLARRLGARLPEGRKRAIKNALAPLQYSNNTRGLGADADMVSWARANPRPVSIVIPSYNDLPYLTACIASVEETCSAFDYEIIIVDDYCQQENSDKLRKLANDRVHVVFKEQRLGFAGTVNAGMALARHDIVLLNSDIVAKPGWLEALQYSAYAIDDAIGLVSPKLVYPNGRIQYGGTYYARLLAPQWFGHFNVGGPATRPAANVATYNRSISGACAYITTEAYAKLGPLDDEFWLGFEDVDYGLRAWEMGIRCYYQPKAMLVHHESASRGYSQGLRELGSMRYFWRRWEHLFLARSIPAAADVDYVISDRAAPTWRLHVEQQAARLAATGRRTEVHVMSEGKPDEAIIASLQSRASIKICCDWAASETLWLSSLEHGKAAYLLPGVESGQFPGDGARQNAIIANYKPEFDYIAPNRWTADQLRAEAAWESLGRIVPVLDPGEKAPVDGTAIVSLAAGDAVRGVLDTIGAAAGVTVVHFDSVEATDELVAEVIATHPRVIVALGEFDSSVIPLRLMSLGAVFVGRHNEKTRYEILDGYNAMLVNPGDLEEVRSAVTGSIEHENVWRELSDNGQHTAERLFELNVDEMSRLLDMIARNAV
jgi:GT2 family glycosyltransferase